MGDETAANGLIDWPCTNPDHLGLCTDNHVHTDHAQKAAYEPHPEPCCECVPRLRRQNEISAAKADARVGELERRLAKIRATSEYAAMYFAQAARGEQYNPWHMTSEVHRHFVLDLLKRLEDAGLPLPEAPRPTVGANGG